MSLTTHWPWSLVFWDEVGHENRRVPTGAAIAAIDSWFHDPGRRRELFAAWELLTEQRPSLRGGMSWMELRAALRPALVRALESGQLVLVAGDTWRGGGIERVTEEPPAPVMAEPQTVKTWIEFVVQDMAGQPIAKQKYRAVLVDGTKKEGETDAKGVVRFEDLEPGLCDFTLAGLDGAA